MLDCTYKTNKYLLPLLHIVGVASSNKSFSAAFVLMQDEKTETYEWALTQFLRRLNLPADESPILCTDRDLAFTNAIKSVAPLSPHLLCVWHVNKNVKMHWKKAGESVPLDDFMARWNAVMYASTEHEYERELQKLEAFCGAVRRADMVDYLKSTWLIHKEKIVVVWTKRFMHFGNAATSRAEGAHAILKGSWVPNSSADLRKLFKKLELHTAQQLGAIEEAAQGSKTKTPLFANGDMFASIVRRVEHHAIKLVHGKLAEVRRATPRAPLLPCTHTFSATMGLPCAHVLQSLGRPLELRDFDEFWRISDPNDQHIVREPLTHTTRRTGSRAAERRNACGFERAAAAVAAAERAQTAADAVQSSIAAEVSSHQLLATQGGPWRPAPTVLLAALPQIGPPPSMVATPVARAAESPQVTRSVPAKRARACCSGCGSEDHRWTKCPQNTQ